ncbi:MAG: TraB/GumN family protein [Clostridia bacterium]
MKILKKIIAMTIPVMILALSVGCTPRTEDQTAKEKPSTPIDGFFWEAKKGDDSIYLVASMQPSKPKLDYLNSEMKTILKDTNALALEINFTDQKTVKDLQEQQKKELYLEKGELKDLLTKEEQTKLDKVLESLNLKYKEVKDLSPSGFLSLVKQVEAEKAGLTGTSLNSFIAEKFSKDKKEIVSLESNKTQLEMLKKSTKDLQDFINTYDADVLKSTITSMNEDMDAFIKGDYDYMEKKANELYTKDQQSYDKQYKERDINMAKKIDTLAKEKNKYVVSVGTMHFFGNDNILKNLENMGYTITQLNTNK